MATPKLGPMFRGPELLKLPGEYPIVWQWWRYGEYLAGFRAEEQANTYGKMNGWMK